jgi:hypothetical protein
MLPAAAARSWSSANGLPQIQMSYRAMSAVWEAPRKGFGISGVLLSVFSCVRGDVSILCKQKQCAVCACFWRGITGLLHARLACHTSSEAHPCSPPNYTSQDEERNALCDFKLNTMYDLRIFFDILVARHLGILISSCITEDCGRVSHALRPIPDIQVSGFAPWLMRVPDGE